MVAQIRGHSKTIVGVTAFALITMVLLLAIHRTQAEEQVAQVKGQEISLKELPKSIQKAFRKHSKTLRLRRSKKKPKMEQQPTK